MGSDSRALARDQAPVGLGQVDRRVRGPARAGPARRSDSLPGPGPRPPRVVRRGLGSSPARARAWGRPTREPSNTVVLPYRRGPSMMLGRRNVQTPTHVTRCTSTESGQLCTLDHPYCGSLPRLTCVCVCVSFARSLAPPSWPRRLGAEAVVRLSGDAHPQLRAPTGPPRRADHRLGGARRQPPRGSRPAQRGRVPAAGLRPRRRRGLPAVRRARRVRWQRAQAAQLAELRGEPAPADRPTDRRR